MWFSAFENIVLFHIAVYFSNPILKAVCVNLIRSWTTAILHSFSLETDLLIKVIMRCVNIKLWDTLGCFHYILNAPRICLHANYLNKIMFKPTTSTSLNNCFHPCKLKVSSKLTENFYPPPPPPPPQKKNKTQKQQQHCSATTNSYKN